MEKIIDYLDDEEFENVKLYTYSFNFENINDNQKTKLLIYSMIGIGNLDFILLNWQFIKITTIQYSPLNLQKCLN